MAKRKRKPIGESGFLTDHTKETVVRIAKYIKDHKRVHKGYLRDIISVGAETFEFAVNHLIDLSLIREKLEYPATAKNKKSKGAKRKFLYWVPFQPNDVTESLESYIAYEQLDLSDYPIRRLEFLNDKQKAYLKKYIFRVIYRGKKAPKYKITRLYNILQVDKGSPVGSLHRVYKDNTREIYTMLKTLMEQGKIQFGYNPKRKTVVVFVNPDYLYSHARWKCENCGKWNAGSNTHFCGVCGGER